VQLERCPKLVLVAINGMCQGGGLVMTLMSDLAVVSDRATFRVPELLRGVADCYLGARLASRVGVAHAKWLLFTDQPFWRRGARVGLVSRVVPQSPRRRRRGAHRRASPDRPPRADGLEP
jgi:enoyl-CoA hydratase/carnithine racemase